MYALYAFVESRYDYSFCCTRNTQLVIAEVEETTHYSDIPGNMSLASQLVSDLTAENSDISIVGKVHSRREREDFQRGKNGGKVSGELSLSIISRSLFLVRRDCLSYRLSKDCLEWEILPLSLLYVSEKCYTKDAFSLTGCLFRQAKGTPSRKTPPPPNIFLPRHYSEKCDLFLLGTR